MAGLGLQPNDANLIRWTIDSLIVVALFVMFGAGISVARRLRECNNGDRSVCPWVGSNLGCALIFAACAVRAMWLRRKLFLGQMLPRIALLKGWGLVRLTASVTLFADVIGQIGRMAIDPTYATLPRFRFVLALNVWIALLSVATTPSNRRRAQAAIRHLSGVRIVLLISLLPTMACGVIAAVGNLMLLPVLTTAGTAGAASAGLVTALAMLPDDKNAIWGVAVLVASALTGGAINVIVCAMRLLSDCSAGSVGSVQ